MESSHEIELKDNKVNDFSSDEDLFDSPEEEENVVAKSNWEGLKSSDMRFAIYDRYGTESKKRKLSSQPVKWLVTEFSEDDGKKRTFEPIYIENPRNEIIQEVMGYIASNFHSFDYIIDSRYPSLTLNTCVFLIQLFNIREEYVEVIRSIAPETGTLTKRAE